MKRIILSFALFSIFFSSVKAQFSVGIETGYNKNFIYSSVGYRQFLKYSPLESFNIGIPVKYKFNNWLGVQADPQFIRKSYRMERTGFYQGVFQDNLNNYLQLPIMGQFSFGAKKLQGFLNLGGFASYWATGKVKGKQLVMFGKSPDVEKETGSYYILDGEEGISYDEAYTFDKRRDRRIDLGLAIGIGINYQIQPKYEFFAEGRYYRSLLDMQKNYMIDQIPRYNDTYVLQLGVLYRFGK